jgi:hypothetical protein
MVILNCEGGASTSGCIERGRRRKVRSGVVGVEWPERMKVDGGVTGDIRNASGLILGLSYNEVCQNNIDVKG